MRERGGNRCALWLVGLALPIALLRATPACARYAAELSWSAVTAAAGYKIHVRQGGLTVAPAITVAAPGAGGTVRHVVDAIPLAAITTFAVTSYNVAGESVRSNEIALTYAAVAAMIDSDGDGLLNAVEDSDLDLVVDPFETDPNDADTDGDGVDDGAEVRTHGTDPLRADTDADGFDDGIEIAAGSDPRDPNVTPPSRCGNGMVDPGESCDGPDDVGCPSLCTGSCACPDYVELPLEAWSRFKGEGTVGLETDELTGSPILRTSTALVPSTKFVVANPSRRTLAITLPYFGFDIRDDDSYGVEVVVRSRTGPRHLLTYVPLDGIATRRGRRAKLPIGAAATSGATMAIERDLHADVEAVFGVEAASVEQVRLYGDVALIRTWLAAAGNAEPPPAEVVVPLSGWERQGPGESFTESDPDTGDATLRAAPRAGAARRFRLRYPGKREGVLVAPYRSLTLHVRDDEALQVDVRVARRGERAYDLRYDAAATALTIKTRGAILPLERTPLVGSPYALVTLDLAGDLARVKPGSTPSGVIGIRLGGRFRASAIVLAGRL